MLAIAGEEKKKNTSRFLSAKCCRRNGAPT